MGTVKLMDRVIFVGIMNYPRSFQPDGALYQTNSQPVNKDKMFYKFLL